MERKPSASLEEGNIEPHHLAELLDIRPDQGIIRLHEQRVVLLSAAAMGLLRKELIDTLGLETARRLFLRFGYADGYHDAVSLRDRSKWASPLEGLRAGVVLHRLEGIVRAEIVKLDHDAATGRFHEEALWHDSYVAEQHVHHYGKGSEPVCWSLVGYASGYASACLGQEIYFRESECLAQGAAKCTVIGKDAESWGTELETLRADFQGGPWDAKSSGCGRSCTSVFRKWTAASGWWPSGSVSSTCCASVSLVMPRPSSSSPAARPCRMCSNSPPGSLPWTPPSWCMARAAPGKEFIVRMIHDQSPRASGPFVSINCAALTETLLESELFGHVRGAFTGAVRDKAGLFEVASNGTLFLDEIGEVAPTVQAKLLRALQEREIRRVGAERTIKVNARVVAATNRDLRAAVAAGTFREDLYFRLGAFVITVPPLRDRREDIPPLVHDFVRRAAARVKKDVQNVSAEAMTALMNYGWPGNVRELEHAIERAVIVARGASIRLRELPPEVSQKPSPTDS